MLFSLLVFGLLEGKMPELLDCRNEGAWSAVRVDIELNKRIGRDLNKEQVLVHRYIRMRTELNGLLTQKIHRITLTLALIHIIGLTLP